MFRTCPVRHITRTTSHIYQNPTIPAQSAEPLKCIWLPQYEESKIFVKKYLRDVTYLHHVIHAPSLRELIEQLYISLDRRTPLLPGHVALLLSVLASSTYNWTARDDQTVFASVEQARRQAASWVTVTMDVLDFSRRTTTGSIEDVQAMIIVLFLVSNLEGLSLRYFDLLSTAIMMARQLALHRIDHHSGPLFTDSIRTEVGRRIWWQLAAQDW